MRWRTSSSTRSAEGDRPPPAPDTGVAFAACAAFPDLHDDWPLVRGALEALGVSARPAVWTDPTIDWSAFDLVVANGAWDNIHRPAEFLSWVDGVAGRGTEVVNSPATLRWNIDKRYLRDLVDAGIPAVPTTWVEPGDGSRLDDDVFAGTEIVVKPTVSGGGFRTARYQAHERPQAAHHVAELLAAGRAAMVQPYQSTVDSAGELGLIFIDGEYSHAIHKAPMIRRGVGATDSLIDNLEISAATAGTGPAPDGGAGAGRGGRISTVRPPTPASTSSPSTTVADPASSSSSCSTRRSSSRPAPRARPAWPVRCAGAWTVERSLAGAHHGRSRVPETPITGVPASWRRPSRAFPDPGDIVQEVHNNVMRIHRPRGGRGSTTSTEGLSITRRRDPRG